MRSLLEAMTARRPRARMLLSVVGIALGVALGYAVHLVNRAAVGDLAAAVRALAGEADLEVRGGRSGFSESLYPRIARLAGVSVAGPVLELAGGERFELLSPDTVMLSVAAADALALSAGDKLQLVVGQRRVALRVAGI